jgi:hypothetical protein
VACKGQPIGRCTNSLIERAAAAQRCHSLPPKKQQPCTLSFVDCIDVLHKPKQQTRPAAPTPPLTPALNGPVLCTVSFARQRKNRERKDAPSSSRAPNMYKCLRASEMDAVLGGSMNSNPRMSCTPSTCSVRQPVHRVREAFIASTLRSATTSCATRCLADNMYANTAAAGLH